MAEFQWWLLIVGLVAGGGLVAVVQMDGRRRDADLAELERRAEAAWIAARLEGREHAPDRATVEAVLRVHREYLELPPPDRFIDAETGEDAEAPPVGSTEIGLGGFSDDDAEGVPDEVGDGGRSRADDDLASAGEEEAAAGEQAHAGSDREQREDR